MSISEALDHLRTSDYGGDSKDKPSEKEGVRVLKLSEPEAKELAGYQEKMGPGSEMVIEDTGKLEGDHFHVMSVKYAQGGGGQDTNADAEAVMDKMRGIPMMAPQVQPSPI